MCSTLNAQPPLRESPLVGKPNVTSLSFSTRVTLFRCLSLPWPPVPLCVKLATFLHKELKILYIQTIIIIVLSLCVYVHLYTCACFSCGTIHPTEWVQWPEGTSGSLFSPSNFTWGVGRNSGHQVTSKYLYLLSHLTSPRGLIFYVLCILGTINQLMIIAFLEKNNAFLLCQITEYFLLSKT